MSVKLRKDGHTVEVENPTAVNRLKAQGYREVEPKKAADANEKKSEGGK
jgi:Mn-dependent DtxR family transcriptional regulator